MPRYLESRYVLLVDNVSSMTSSRDLDREFAFAGPIRDIVKDNKFRCALVEFEKSADAKYAWNKMNGFRMDGREWKVEWATLEDFKMFGWKWWESSPEPPRDRSRDRRSRSRSRGRERSPPDTPYNKDDKRSQSASPSRRGGRSSRSRSPSPRRDY